MLTVEHYYHNAPYFLHRERAAYCIAASVRPGSNRRPVPWQGTALPTELLTHAPSLLHQQGIEPQEMTYEEVPPHRMGDQDRTGELSLED